MVRWIKQRSIRVCIILGVYAFLAPYLSYNAHQILYTTSVLIKELLTWIIPLTVCFFIAYTVSEFEHKAPLFVLVLVIFEAISNFSSVLYAYGWGHILVKSIPYVHNSVSQGTDFIALWRLPVTKPVWWSADKGCILGTALGIFGAYFRQSLLLSLITSGKKSIENVLTKFFSPIMPVFIIGFFSYLYQTGMLSDTLLKYGLLTIWVFVVLVSYAVILLGISCGWKIVNMWEKLKNLLPAWGMALSSGCSLSTMPWTIRGTSKNLKDPQLAEAVIPATTNIQQIADCIIQTLICFTLYVQFFKATPSLIVWLNFTIVFVAARFATTAILGGAIFLMLPIYEHYLSFTPEMLVIVLGLNAVMDPLVTSFNVLSNGILCGIFEKVWIKVKSYDFNAKKI